MKKPILLLIASLILGLGVSGCTKTQHSATSSESKKVRPATRPKILVQAEPKGTTGVYQQDLRIVPALRVDEKQVASEHGFTLFSMASFVGKEPKCIAKSLVLSISHDTMDVQNWRFPSNSSVMIAIDGDPVPLNVYAQLPYGLPKMANYIKDPQASETLTISPTCEMYQRLAKAKAVEFRIGNGSFDLSPESIASFREFAQAIGYK